MTRRRKKVRRARKPQKPRKAAPSARRDPLDKFISTGARALDLNIQRAWLPAVRTHLRVTLEHGARVTYFALADDAEPAPVYEA